MLARKAEPGNFRGQDRDVEAAGCGRKTISRNEFIRLLNEDLAREYQAVIACVVYSQAITGAAYMSIAKELEKCACEELSHALIIEEQIDYLGGENMTQPKMSTRSSMSVKARIDRVA